MVVKTEDGFVLCSERCELRPNYFRDVFFFCKNPNERKPVDKVPEDMKIIKSPFTGLPMLAHTSSSHKLPSYKDRQGVNNPPVIILK